MEINYKENKKYLNNEKLYINNRHEMNIKLNKYKKSILNEKKLIIHLKAIICINI